MAEDSPAHPDPNSESVTPAAPPAAAKPQPDQDASEPAIADTVADSIGEAIAGSGAGRLLLGLARLEEVVTEERGRADREDLLRFQVNEIDTLRDAQEDLVRSIDLWADHSTWDTAWA